MAKHRKKLSGAEKAERRRRRRQYMTVFMNGKQNEGQTPKQYSGMDENTFIQRNANPIWLHKEDMWEGLEK